MPQRVGTDAFGDSCPVRDAAHNPGGGMTVKPPATRIAEDRSFHAFADGKVDRPSGTPGEGDGHDLSTLALDRERAVPAFETEPLDVRSDGFADPKAVEREHTDERVIACTGEPRGNQHCADLVAVEPHRVRLIIEARATHMYRGRQRNQAFLFGVAVEARDCA